MKKIFLSLMLCCFYSLYSSAQLKVPKAIDVHRYEGSWFINASIPTGLDKNWICTIDRYAWNEARQYFDAVSDYKKKPGGKQKHLKQKLIPIANTGFTKYKAKIYFLKADYDILYIDDNYTHAILGNKDKSYLYFVSRKAKLSSGMYNEMVELSKKLGYDTGKIVKQVQEE